MDKALPQFSVWAVQMPKELKVFSTKEVAQEFINEQSKKKEYPLISYEMKVNDWKK